MSKTTKVRVSKAIEELDGINDVIYAPRSWSPGDLKEACANLVIDQEEELSPRERATVKYLLKYFFYIQHQTGLYNVQRRLWSSIARTANVKVKRSKKTYLFSKEKFELVDIVLEDVATKKFIKARLVQEIDSGKEPVEGKTKEKKYPGFDSLTGIISSKCVGVFYIIDKAYGPRFLEKILKRTNAKDFVDRYRSPIRKHCSLNLIQYAEIEEAVEYRYKLVHPDLDRKIEARVRLSNQNGDQ